MREKKNSKYFELVDKMNDVKSNLETQKKIRRKYFVPMAGLLVCQYAVGLLMIALWFLGETSGNVIVAFGSLFLLCTLLQHRYRPGAKFIRAKARVLKLTRLYRTASTNLNNLKSGSGKSPDVSTTLNEIDRGLDEFHRSLHLDYAILQRKKPDLLERYRNRKNTDKYQTVS